MNSSVASNRYPSENGSLLVCSPSNLSAMNAKEMKWDSLRGHAIHSRTRERFNFWSLVGVHAVGRTMIFLFLFFCHFGEWTKWICCSPGYQIWCWLCPLFLLFIYFLVQNKNCVARRLFLSSVCLVDGVIYTALLPDFVWFRVVKSDFRRIFLNRNIGCFIYPRPAEARRTMRPRAIARYWIHQDRVRSYRAIDTHLCRLSSRFYI